jgi:signal transduction histidine kinase
VLDFAALLGEKVEAWRNAPNIRAAELTIEVVLPEVPTRLLGDAHSLSSVIWNLLVNAQQAACESDHQVVRVVLVAGDQAHILVVEDSGSGIAPRDYEHLFEPFFTTRSHGTGIGLATVRRGVDTHRGRIVVGKSELGGARFEVRLPRDLRRHVEPLLRQSLAATPVALD